LEVPRRAPITREWDDPRLERNAKHRNLVFTRDVLDEIHELGTEHFPDEGAGRMIVDVLRRSVFDGAAGISE
jgi:hypothetical protein